MRFCLFGQFEIKMSLVIFDDLGDWNEKGDSDA